MIIHNAKFYYIKSFIASTTFLSLSVSALYYCFYLHKSRRHYKHNNDREWKDIYNPLFSNITEDEEKNDEKENLEKEKNHSGCKNGTISSEASEDRRVLTPNTITIAYASMTGTSQSFAMIVEKKIKSILEPRLSVLFFPIVLKVCRVEEIDWWDEFLNDEQDDYSINEQNLMSMPPILIFLLSTWTHGKLPPTSMCLLESLAELLTDWRVSPKPLSLKNNMSLQVASFGIGSSAYNDSTFCKPSKDVFRKCLKLGAKSLLGSTKMRKNNSNKLSSKNLGWYNEVGMGDNEKGDDCNVQFNNWLERILCSISILMNNKNPEKKKTNSDITSSKHEGGNDQVDVFELNLKKADCDNIYSDSSISETEPEVTDLEDIGDSIIVETEHGNNKTNCKKQLQEMVTPTQAKALQKEGYKLIGTHSAIKLCRWTKHQLRGRGGCYKHTFYGITSYQCMEATPSLACANKCVFCWRHHKNPVGTSWRWKTDDPDYIVSEAIQKHLQLIKETKGIPGIQMDRWKDAHTVRHCALSLVGEPIMYPRIDELLQQLHVRKISTFLVTNGQHPEAIRDLRPITQLYVSVDASTPESLEAIDRPLFSDAWDRLCKSLMYLKHKGQRTVARLTVVKGWNSQELKGYAKLIYLGRCSFVEVKGVTFCGKSDASSINMSNIPWHHEVVALTLSLQKELDYLRIEEMQQDTFNEIGNTVKNLIPQYGIACEHRHSCCVLLARKDQFYMKNNNTNKFYWKTWIDYDRFHTLAAKNLKDPTFTFGVQDYAMETPEWALFGSKEEGFDPTDTRYRKKNKHPKYTTFDKDGIPLTDHNGKELTHQEKSKLRELMEIKKKEIGDQVSLIEHKNGEKVIEDASLIFRALTITK